MAILAAGLLLLAAIAWITPRAVQRWQVMRWQRQCLNHVAPPDRIVYESDPDEIARLLASPLPYQGSLAAGRAYLIPPAYQQLVVSQSVGTAFLHERATPQGQRRLVGVDLFLRRVPRGGLMMLGATVIDPAGVARGPQVLPVATRGDAITIMIDEGKTLRVFAGQPDPADPSHFTIDYLLGEQRHTLDGWLQDNGDVVIETRDPS